MSSRRGLPLGAFVATSGRAVSEVAALFTRPDSPYLRLGCDCFDLARDARTFCGSVPVVAHPPCRGWSRLSHFAKVRPGELELAPWAVETVRRVGGVLEHPLASRLWRHMGIERGRRDRFGGVLVPIQQAAYGHRAPKWTGIYCVRTELRPRLCWGGVGEFVSVERMGRAERERTPFELASDLVEAARRVC